MNAKMLKCMNAQMRKCMNNRNMNTEKWDPKPETGWGWRERENVRWSDGEALQAEGLKESWQLAINQLAKVEKTSGFHFQ